MSVNGGQLAELGVGDEPSFLGSEPFHGREHLRNRSSGSVEPELLGLQPDRSSPLFFPSTIPRSAPTRPAAYGSIDGGSWN